MRKAINRSIRYLTEVSRQGSLRDPSSMRAFQRPSGIPMTDVIEVMLKKSISTVHGASIGRSGKFECQTVLNVPLD